MRAPPFVLGLGSVLTLVCCITHEIPSSDGAGDDDDSDGGETATNLPACPYATGDSDSGTAAGITYGRTFLECELGNGSESCLSNDPTTCPDHGASVGGTIISCSNQCEETQYGISVDLGVTSGADGGTYIPTAPVLPSSCEQESANLAGVAFYCCDCPTN